MVDEDEDEVAIDATAAGDEEITIAEQVRGRQLNRAPRGAPARRFAVLDCEDRPKWTGHELYWIDRLRRDGEEWRSYRVWAGELPDDLDSLCGLIVTGSHHSAADDSLAWLEPLFSFLRAVVADQAGPRVVGACFGCQAVARALGGRIGANPHGRFVFGAEPISLDPGFFTRWFASGPPEQAPARPSISLLESHGECVLDLPPGAELLGRSASSAHEIFAIGERVLALQGHPELTREALVEKILPGLRENRRLDPGEEQRALQSMDCELDDRFVLRVIRRFLDGPASSAR